MNKRKFITGIMYMDTLTPFFPLQSLFSVSSIHNSKKGQCGEMKRSLRKRSEMKKSVKKHCVVKFGALLHLVMLILLTTLAVDLAAQTGPEIGAVIGTINDSKTGEALPGARVMIEGTGLRTTSDDDGRYVLRQVPVGEQLVVVHFMGYNSSVQTIKVEPGEQVIHHRELVDTFREADRIFGLGRQRDEARTLTRQRESMSVSNVITSEQIDRFGSYGDYTVQDVMGRMPGVQLGRRGESNLRGVGQMAGGMYHVLIDGQRMATTGFGDRSTDLSMIPLDQIEHIEVIKTLTPDMYADAISGIVNVRMHGSKGDKTSVTLRGGGQFTPRYFDYTGAGGRAALRLATPLSEYVSFGASVNYQKTNFGWEGLGINYGVNDFGNGPVDIVERVSPELNFREREKVAGNARFNFHPTVQSSYFVKGSFNVDNLQGNHQNIFFDANGDHFNPESTGREGRVGNYGYTAAKEEYEARSYTINAGGKNVFDLFDLSYDAGWAFSDIDQKSYNLPFSAAALGVDYEIDMSNRSRPLMNITNPAVREDGTVSYALVRLEELGRTVQEQTHNQFTANVNLNIPYRFGSFKFGSNNLISIKDGRHTEADFRHFQTKNLSNFRPMQNEFINVLGHSEYRIPWMINTDDALLWFRVQRHEFSRDVNKERLQSDIRRYNTTERIIAGYGMMDMSIGNLDVLVGARIEYTHSKNEGRVVEFDNDGEHLLTETITENNDYVHLFPNAHLKYRLSDWTSLRLAYTRSIARPDFDRMAPFVLIDWQQQLVYSGNANLEPMLSDNLDFSIDHYFRSIGHVGAAVFHKSMSNFIIERIREFEDPEENVWIERSYENGSETTTVYGVELSWQQNLTFLPGFLGNFGTYANYTWSRSEFELDSREEVVRLPGHSPHVINAALHYSQNRFSGQVSWHRTAPVLGSLRGSSMIAPSISGTREVYLDRYEDGAQDLSLSMRFRLSERFRVWMDASNLLRKERRIYDYSRHHYPRYIDHRESIQFRAGIRYDF